MMEQSETVANLLTGKHILITGGTGSLGQELVRQILAMSEPERLVILSRDEAKQLAMQQTYGSLRMRYFLGDVRDRDRLRRAFEGIDIVLHAAALKQVPALEYNPREAILTNVMGALNVIDAALDCGVQQVLAVSTDKSVAPHNLYGATKLCMEKLMIQSNSYSGYHATRFSCVRYGNVLGSRGSVLPIWQEARKTGLLPITDGRMTRFLITLPQAGRFVLSSLAMMRGGEIFVPRLPSIRMVGLARAIAPKAKLEIIGIRPGEKIDELLISGHEASHTRRLVDRFVILPVHTSWQQEAHAGDPPMPEGWSYGSGSNDWWLSGAEVLAALGGLEGENEFNRPR